MRKVQDLSIKVRRAKVMEAFKANPGLKMNSKCICEKIGIETSHPNRCAVVRDVHHLMELDTNIKYLGDEGAAAYRGYIYMLPGTKTPVMIDNKINVSRNAEGIKDQTAAKAIRSIEPLSVYPGGVYSCTTNKGEEALYLTVRGPFMCNDVEKVTVVPVYRPIRSANEREGMLKFSGKNKGITLDIYPYDISTKPTKYFKRLEDEVLECDLRSVKVKIREFLDIPKEVEYKTVEKTVEVEKPVEVEKIVTEKVEIPVWPKDIEKELQHQINMWKCKAEVYEDAYKMAIEAFANARKE